MFYIMPTILVVWLTVLALGSNTAVWNPNEEETFEININAYQWYFEFDYAEQLTWEDTGTGIDVLWDQGVMQVDATDTEATTVKVKIGSDKSDYEINNGSSLMAITANYDSAQHAYVKVYDAEDALIHTWENIPRGHTFVTPSDPMIVPCDELVDATMKSKSADTTDTRNVGVQHAFWVPEWGMKEDFVPGLEDGTTLYFMPDDSGTFPIRCAEYCGLQHSVMTGQVMVVAREGMTCDYDSGVAKSDTSSSDSYDGGEM